MADVVAVADVRDADAFEAAEALADREHVGKRLARVELVGEAVHDRNGCVLREFVDVGLPERPDHDRIEVAREHDRGVANRLSTPELGLAGRKVETHTAELGHGDAE